MEETAKKGLVPNCSVKMPVISLVMTTQLPLQQFLHKRVVAVYNKEVARAVANPLELYNGLYL